jgi:HEAT repeat protein
MLVIGGGVAFFVPRFHFAISGWWQGEAFYAGRPTSYWAEAAQGGFYAGERDVFRSLRQGGASAVPVLCELSKHPDLVLRSQAMLALSLIDWDPRLVPASKLRLLYGDPKSIKIDGAAAGLSEENRRALEETLLDIVQNSAASEDRSAAALALDRLGVASAPDALSEAMKSGSRNLDVRLQVATRLWDHHHNPSEVLPTLDEKLHSKDQLTDESWNSLSSAISFLAEVGRRDKRAALVRLRELLGDPVPQVRRSACSALAQLTPDPTIKDLLVAVLGDDDAEVRRSVAHSLASQWPNDKRSIPVLLESLSDGRWAVTTLRLLGRVGVGDEQTVHTLLETFQSSENADVRGAAAQALADAAPGSANAVQAMIAAVQHDSTVGVRQAALSALARLKSPTAIPVLVDTASELHSSDSQSSRTRAIGLSLREAAVRALGAMDSEPAAVRSLVGILKNNPNKIVRRVAAEMLGHAKVESQAAVGALTGALDDSDTRIAAAVAICQLDPGNCLPIDILLGILKTKDKESDTQAISALGQIGPAAARAVPALLRIVTENDVDPSSASMAIWALGRIGPAAEAALPALMKKLGRDDAISMTAMEALAQLGPAAKSAVPKLKASLASSSPFHRIKAAATLYKIDAKTDAYLPVIVDCLRDKSPLVRSTAISALGDLGPAAAGAVPALRVALEHERARMDDQVRDALRKITSDHEPADQPVPGARFFTTN